eukprot:1175599-Prorocentrum_minimum.AAC.6
MTCFTGAKSLKGQLNQPKSSKTGHDAARHSCDRGYSQSATIGSETWFSRRRLLTCALEFGVTIELDVNNVGDRVPMGDGQMEPAGERHSGRDGHSFRRGHGGCRLRGVYAVTPE